MKTLLFFHIVLALATASLVQAAEEPLVPEDTCVVELQLPEGATVNVDGRD